MILRAFAVVLAGFAFSTPVVAQDLIQWGEAGGWDVLVDPTLGNGCLIQSEFEDGSTVRIGLDASDASAYITVFNESWGDIEADKTYPVSFDLDGVVYEGEAKGIWLDDVPGADIVFVNSDFMFDLATKKTLTLYHDKDEVMAIDLTGTAAGLDQVITCQDKQG